MIDALRYLCASGIMLIGIGSYVMRITGHPSFTRYPVMVDTAAVLLLALGLWVAP